MSEVIDLRPAGDRLAAIVANIDDAQLLDDTPCEGTSVAQLLNHVAGLLLAFTWAADKYVPTGGSPQATLEGRLDDEWRMLIRLRVNALVSAWSAPGAWKGMTEAGGVISPADQMGMVALNEMTMHGWDLAVATGQAYEVTDDDAQRVFEFTQVSAQPEFASHRAGLFGPVIDVRDNAPVFDRALGYAGRSPNWQP